MPLCLIGKMALPMEGQMQFHATEQATVNGVWARLQPCLPHSVGSFVQGTHSVAMCQGPSRPKKQRLWIQGPAPCSPTSKTNSACPSVPCSCTTLQSCLYVACLAPARCQVCERRGQARCPLGCFHLLHSALLTPYALRGWESCLGIPCMPRVSSQSPY